MGILKTHIRLLAMEQVRSQIVRGRVITFGQQAVYSDHHDVERILIEHGLTPKPLPGTFDTKNKIPSWKGSSYDRFTNAATIFALLGATDTSVADISDYEGAEIVTDLNQPVAKEYLGQFDVVFDAGTIEHVFNVPQAFENVCKLLKPTGSIILHHPSSNALDHGFYSFSPTLYFDYFGANGFTDMRCYITEGSPYTYGKKQHVFEYKRVGQEYPLLSGQAVGSVFFATRRADHVAVAQKIPTQSVYLATPPIRPSGKLKNIARSIRYRVMNHIPFFVEKFLYTRVYRNARGDNLKYIGRF